MDLMLPIVILQYSVFYLEDTVVIFKTSENQIEQTRSVPRLLKDDDVML